MNFTIKQFIQKEIQKGLKQCTNGQRRSFALIFMNHELNNLLPEKVADVIPDDMIEPLVLNVAEHDLDRALTMVESTAHYNKLNRKGK